MNNNFYNKVQEDKREAGGYYPEKIDFIIKKTGQHKKILDVGCNDGFIGGLLVKRKNIVHGIDIVSKNLKTAKKKGLQVKKVNIESEKFPFPSEFFDFVILGDVIEHIFDTDKLLRECRRVLKKNGKLILTTPNVASLGRRLMLFFGISPFLEFSTELTTNGLPSVGHIRYYTVGGLSQQLRHNGFTVNEVRGNGIYTPLFEFKFLGKFIPSLSAMLLCLATKNNSVGSLSSYNK